MGLNVMRLVIEHRLGTASRKSAMLALANYADDDTGGDIYASIATYAAHADLSERAMRNCMREFERERLIAFEGYKRLGETRVKRWRLDLAELAALPLVETWRDRVNRHHVPVDTAPNRQIASSEPANRVARTGKSRRVNRHHVPGIRPDKPAKNPANKPARRAAEAATACPQTTASAPASPPPTPRRADRGGASILDALRAEFPDEISKKHTAKEWGADVAALEAKGCHLHRHVLPGLRMFLKVHRRRAKNDATWAPLRRPLRHPRVVQNALELIGVVRPPSQSANEETAERLRCVESSVDWTLRQTGTVDDRAWLEMQIEWCEGEFDCRDFEDPIAQWARRLADKLAHILETAPKEDFALKDETMAAV